MLYNTTTESACSLGQEPALVPVFQPGLGFRDERLHVLIPGGTTGTKIIWLEFRARKKDNKKTTHSLIPPQLRSTASSSLLELLKLQLLTNTNSLTKKQSHLEKILN